MRLDTIAVRSAESLSEENSITLTSTNATVRINPYIDASMTAWNWPAWNSQLFTVIRKWKVEGRGLQGERERSAALPAVSYLNIVSAPTRRPVDVSIRSDLSFLF